MRRCCCSCLTCPCTSSAEPQPRAGVLSRPEARTAVRVLTGAHGSALEESRMSKRAAVCVLLVLSPGLAHAHGSHSAQPAAIIDPLVTHHAILEDEAKLNLFGWRDAVQNVAGGMASLELAYAFTDVIGVELFLPVGVTDTRPNTWRLGRHRAAVSEGVVRSAVRLGDDGVCGSHLSDGQRSGRAKRGHVAARASPAHRSCARSFRRPAEWRARNER